MDQTAIMAELRALAQRLVGTMLGKVFEQADNALFDISQTNSSATEQQGFLDAMRDLRKQRPAIEDAVRGGLASDFARVERRGRTDVGSAPEFNADSLSLVDADVLDEQLAVERIAIAVEKRNLEGLGLLALGIAEVVGIKEIEADDNPLAPLKLAESFNKHIRPVLVAPQTRLVVQKLFERVLLTEFTALLAELNRLLSDRGIKVKLPEAVVRRAREAAATARREAGEPDPPPEGAASGRSRVRVEGGGFTLAEGEGSEVPDAFFAAMMEVFASYLNGRRDPTGKRDGAPTVSSDAMMDTLTDLQANPPASLLAVATDSQTSIAEPLRRELLAAAIASGRAVEGSKIDLADEQALSLVGMLFDVLLDQGEFEPEIRERFVRLSVPYAKVALLDRRMFAHKTHPARQLLNALAEACEGNHAESQLERDLLGKTTALIDRLLAEWQDDAETFTALEREFDDVVAQHRKRVALTEKRTADAHKGRERLEEARATASLELGSLLGGRAAPKPIANFLRHEWQHHLTITALRDGDDSDAYRKAASAGTSLWLAMLACERGADVPSGLTELLLPAMNASGQGADEARVLGEEIVKALKAVRPRKENDTAPADVRAFESGFEIVSAAETVAEVPVKEPDDDIKIQVDSRQFQPDDLGRIRALQVGAWVDLTDASGEHQAAKLSWISPISHKMLFVNRRGVRLCALTPEEMAALMRENKLSIREVDTAFERAMTQVVGKLQPGEAGGSAPASAAAR